MVGIASNVNNVNKYYGFVLEIIIFACKPFKQYNYDITIARGQ